MDRDLLGQHTGTRWIVTYLVSTPVPDGPMDRDLPGQHTSTRWTVTYLVSTPVPDGP